jgi:MFS family permease
MLAPYRSVLATPGAKLWTTAGFVARMPISMVSIAIVLLISGSTGSYALAGTVTATYSVTAACSAPILGRLIDVIGQSRVLVPASVAFGAAMTCLVVGIEAGWPTPVPHVFAAVAGIAYPPIGACVRARWACALGESDALHTAYAFEAVVDEAIFMAGPIIVTLLATAVAYWLGVVSVIGFAVIGGSWLATQRATQPVSHGRSGAAARRDPLGWRLLVVLVLAAVCLGALFGSTEVVTVAFATEDGHRGYAGVLLAAWAAGSLIAGVITGSMNAAIPALRRFRLGALGMACAMLPLPFISNIALLGVVLFAGGFAVSPTLVACVSLVHARVPASRLTEGITWITTGVGLGVAPGAAIAGQLLADYGASAAFGVSAVGGALAAVLAALTPATAGPSLRPPRDVAPAPSKRH